MHLYYKPLPQGGLQNQPAAALTSSPVECHLGCNEERATVVPPLFLSAVAHSKMTITVSLTTPETYVQMKTSKPSRGLL